MQQQEKKTQQLLDSANVIGLALRVILLFTTSLHNVSSWSMTCSKKATSVNTE